jgi:hypothetical protein
VKSLKKVRKNIKNIRIIPFVLLNLFIFSTKAHSQEIELFSGKTNLFLNDKFTVTIFFPKENKRDFKVFHQYYFPDIEDFEKGRTLYLEEEEPKGYKIIQYYKPRKAGTFLVNPIRIRIKDKTYSSKRVTVKVSARNNYNPEPEPEIKIEEDLEYEEPKLDAFLDIQSNKSKVYTGEGFGITLSLLISTLNKTEVTFIDLGEQRKEFIKKMKPTGCFIEDFSVSTEVDTVVIKDRKYTKWKLYEGVFFPIDSNSIKIPVLNLSVLTYALAKNKSQSLERKTMVKYFSTKPLLIKVSGLPINKGTEQIPVGYFKVSENAYPDKFQTGKSFKYTFNIIGEGNISAIPAPVVVPSEYFDIYAPKISQEISRQQGRIVGGKSFVYYVTPKEPGVFQLSDYFKWAFFNTSNGRIDTLTSSLSLKVRGESLKNNYISANNPGDFYNRINTDSNQMRLLVKSDNLKFMANIFILVMLVITGIIVLKK